jgi:cytidylate kinase
MPIITIYRGAFSGGPALAERVAGELGYRCVSREVLLEASRRYGIPETKFTEVLESAPHWWERWRESLRIYRVALQAAMCEVAQSGNLVYHGHLGHELLRGIRHVLKIHLTATMEYQVAQVQAREGLDEVAAQRYIEQTNKARTRLEAAKREEYQPTPESEQAFQDLTVGSRAEAVLVTTPKTRNLSVHVQAKEGVVRVTGILTQPALQEEIVSIIEGVEGVTKVEADLESPPIEYMFP